MQWRTGFQFHRLFGPWQEVDRIRTQIESPLQSTKRVVASWSFFVDHSRLTRPQPSGRWPARHGAAHPKRVYSILHMIISIHFLTLSNTYHVLAYNSVHYTMLHTVYYSICTSKCRIKMIIDSQLSCNWRSLGCPFWCRAEFSNAEWPDVTNLLHLPILLSHTALDNLAAPKSLLTCCKY